MDWSMVVESDPVEVIDFHDKDCFVEENLHIVQMFDMFLHLGYVHFHDT